MAFVDDAWFLGPPEHVALAQKRYAYLYAQLLCGELNEAKSGAFSFGLTHVDALAAGLSPDIPWASCDAPDGTTLIGGLRLMGAPLGPIEFQRAFLERGVTHAISVMRRVSRLHKLQDRLAMLRLSFSKRFGHLQRLIDTGGDQPMLHLMEKWDDAVMASTADLVSDRGDLNEPARRIAALPPGLGGLGIESAAARATPAFYASFTTCKGALTTLRPRLAPVYSLLHLPGITQVTAAHVRLLEIPKVAALLSKIDGSPQPVRRLQGKLTALIQMETHRLLLGELDDRTRALVQSAASNPHLVCALPKTDSSLRRDNGVISCTLARRLGIPQHLSFVDVNRCQNPCSNCMRFHCGPHLDESLYCAHNPQRLTRWHNPITSVLTDCARAHGFSVSTDKGHDPNSGRRTDIIIAFGTRRVFVDTRTVVSVHPDAYVEESVFPGLGLDKGEDEKVKKHGGYLGIHYPNDAFVPFVIDEQGGVAPSGRALLERIFATSPHPVASKTYWLRRLAACSAQCLHDMMHVPFVAGIAQQQRVSPPTGAMPRGGVHPDHDSDPPSDVAAPPGPHLISAEANARPPSPELQASYFPSRPPPTPNPNTPLSQTSLAHAIPLAGLAEVATLIKECSSLQVPPPEPRPTSPTAFATPAKAHTTLLGMVYHWGLQNSVPPQSGVNDPAGVNALGNLNVLGNLFATAATLSDGDRGLVSS